MRTVSVRLADLERCMIPIGFVDENLHTRVRFDCKKMFDEYPTALPSLAVSPPEGSTYPAIVTKDGDFVVWDVTASDCASDGTGEIQLTFVVGEIVAKSYVGRIRVTRSLNPSGEIPDPVQDWITQANAVLAEIPETIDGEFDAITAEASTLTPGSSATASFDSETKVLSIGVPRGQKGDDGYTPVKGVDYFDGLPGDPGADGFSPIATVSKSGKKSTITITDKNGTTTAEVNDGTDGDPTALIDDTTPAVNKTYSSNKLESELSDVKSAINGIEDDQKIYLMEDVDISGTRYYEYAVDIPAGTYRLVIESVESSGTGTASRITFLNGTSNVTSVNVTRATGCDQDITLSGSVNKIWFYAVTNLTDSEGKTFTYNDVTIYKDTGLNQRITSVESDVTELQTKSALYPFADDYTEQVIQWTKTDKFYNSQGQESSINNYYQYEINVSNGDKFKIVGTYDYQKCVYVTLTSGGVVIQKLYNTSKHETVSNISITIGPTETKLVLQSSGSDRTTYQLKKLTGMALDYDAQKTLNPLYEKSVIFTGDSICNGSSAGDGLSGWAGRIGRANNMEWTNAGVSGATITAGLSAPAVISETNFGTAEYIIIEGGVNDADTIGNALSVLPEKFGSYTMNDFTSEFTNDTFCGAIEYMFQSLVSDHKGAKIGVIIAQKMGRLNANVTDYTKEHNNKRFYFETLMKLCEKWGIPYLNLWDGSVFNPMIPAQYTVGQESTEGKFYTDGQHLTTDGYDAIAPIIEAWMKTL